uniref:Uncharacterized protein n=1 Tax=Picea sitchensis TaxID=3332 RepID=A9NW59_PICSI|nr:unknown [Picea sitchensis]
MQNSLPKRIWPRLQRGFRLPLSKKNYQTLQRMQNSLLKRSRPRL